MDERARGFPWVITRRGRRGRTETAREKVTAWDADGRGSSAGCAAEGGRGAEGEQPCRDRDGERKSAGTERDEAS